MKEIKDILGKDVEIVNLYLEDKEPRRETLIGVLQCARWMLIYTAKGESTEALDAGDNGMEVEDFFEFLGPGEALTMEQYEDFCNGKAVVTDNVWSEQDYRGNNYESLRNWGADISCVDDKGNFHWKQQFRLILE